MPRSPPSSQTTTATSLTSGGGGVGTTSSTDIPTGGAGTISVPTDIPKIAAATPTPSTLVHEETHEESDGDEDDDEKVLETSSDGRWQKINHHVTRDVPGIDDAYLAMDTEEGVEVVWNEVIYSQSSRKANKGSKDRLKAILQGLTSVKHQNIVNFYDFWHDKVKSKDRLVFITEYITSGSLSQFLKKNKKVKGTNSISEKIWRRWCRQILSALSYLHKNEIIHGNLSLASIFIQHNGLVKIGSVSPDAIHQHVKTKNREAATGLHYAAPELAEGPIRTPADIYAFGICALEMLNLDLLGNGEATHHTRADAVQKALDQLNPMTRDFIQLCIDPNPQQRPKAQLLLKQPVLQEVFTLKLLSAFALRGYNGLQDKLDDCRQSADTVLATVPLKSGGTRNYTVGETSQIDIEKYFDEINQDFLLETELPVDSPGQEIDEPGRTRVVPESNASSNDRSSTNYELETRRIESVLCDIRPLDNGKNEIYIKLQFGNKMERELRSELQEDEIPEDLVNDLVRCGLLANEDTCTVINKLSPLFKNSK